MNVPNKTCLSNTRNYTNISKHYYVSTTVSAATDVLPGGAGVFFAVTSSRSECQYHHASLMSYARTSPVKTTNPTHHERCSLCNNSTVLMMRGNEFCTTRHKAGIPKLAEIAVGRFTKFCFQPHHRNMCLFIIYLHYLVSIALWLPLVW